MEFMSPLQLSPGLSLNLRSHGQVALTVAPSRLLSFILESLSVPLASHAARIPQLL